MRAGTLAGSHLHGGEGHQCLVGQGGRAEGGASQGDGSAHHRVFRRHVRGAEAGGTGLRLAGDVAADFLQQFRVAVALVAADVYHEGAAVGDDVVLRAGVYHRDTHLDRTQQGRHLGEAVAAEPGDVVQYLIDGIVALVAGGVPGASGGGHVEHHQSLFGNGGLHLGRFAHQGEADGRQFGQHAFDAPLARHLLLARGKEQQVVCLPGATQREEHLQQAHHACSRVVAAQPVELSVALQRGGEGLFPPSVHGFHGVDV